MVKGNIVDKENKIMAYLRLAVKRIVQNSVELMLFATFYVM